MVLDVFDFNFIFSFLFSIFMMVHVLIFSTHLSTHNTLRWHTVSDWKSSFGSELAAISVEQIRWVFDDNLGIIFQISP